MEKDNILLAEFLGMQKTELGWYDAEENLNYPYGKEDNTFDSLLFYDDLNWLMSVVDFIEDLRNTDGWVLFDVSIRQGVVYVIDKITTEEIIEVVADTKIDAIYQACVEFVKWYKD